MFCDEMFVGDTLPGLKGFIVKFMILMSKVNLTFKNQLLVALLLYKTD